MLNLEQTKTLGWDRDGIIKISRVVHTLEFLNGMNRVRGDSRSCSGIHFVRSDKYCVIFPLVKSQ